MYKTLLLSIHIFVVLEKSYDTKWPKFLVRYSFKASLDLSWNILLLWFQHPKSMAILIWGIATNMWISWLKSFQINVICPSKLCFESLIFPNSSWNFHRERAFPRTCLMESFFKFSSFHALMWNFISFCLCSSLSLFQRCGKVQIGAKTYLVPR
jgi:hypothetical protein